MTTRSRPSPAAVVRAAAIVFVVTIAPTALAQSPDPMTQRVVPCTVCHGLEGRAGTDVYYPRIAGKPAGYLYNQLLNFRDGRRHYALMTHLLDVLPDAYLKDMARHFAALDPPHRSPAPSPAAAALLERGRVLAVAGDSARELPACVACHGDALMGAQPAMPGLLGLPRDYINAQLGAWKAGARRAHEPDCMAEVARRLTPEDVSAVSTWLAAQPVPDGAKPASAIGRLPLQCGGVAPQAAGAVR